MQQDVGMSFDEARQKRLPRKFDDGCAWSRDACGGAHRLNPLPLDTDRPSLVNGIAIKDASGDVCARCTLRTLIGPKRA